MKSLFSFAFLTALFFATIASVRSEVTHIVADSTRGYKIVIIGATWTTSAPLNSNLVVTFEVQHTDGTPATFASDQPNIYVHCWADNLDATTYHSGTAKLMQNSRFYVTLPGIDPRARMAHLEFDVQDPNTSPLKSGVTHDTFSFDNVPLPTALDTKVPLDLKYTSVNGTVVTIHSLTFVSHIWPNPNSPPGTVFQVSADHSANADDQVVIEVIGATGANAPVYHRTTISDPEIVSAVPKDIEYTQFELGLDKSMKFTFSIRERIESVTARASWMALSADVPLDNLKAPVCVPPAIAGYSNSMARNARFSLAVQKDKNFPTTAVLIANTKSERPDTTWYLTDAYWDGASAPKRVTGYNAQSLSWRNEMYWQNNGAAVSPGEINAMIECDAGKISWPLVVTFSEIKRTQQVVTFANVPMPGISQVSSLDIVPIDAPNMPLHLTEFDAPGILSSSKSPAFDARRRAWAMDEAANLIFTFQDAAPDYVYVSMLSARDAANNVLDWRSKLQAGPGGKQHAESRQYMLPIASSPVGSASLTIKVLVSTETQIGEPVTFSIDKDGTWTVTKPTPISGD